MNDARLGLYLHIPFCRHRCDYCAFATWTDRGHLEARYLAACRAHIRQATADTRPVTSVFVGGGTPSLVDPDALVDVLAAIPRAAGAEVTVECNPDDLDERRATLYANGGVTRLSIGVQSMTSHVLVSLGRSHDPANVRRAVKAARHAGLEVNLDLIYGAVGESTDDWLHTLTEAVDLAPDHISAYGLTVEPGTPLAADPPRHPDDDDQADKYVLATEHLASAGYEWYEISNWSRPGHACRHNLQYWSGGEYLAIGSAAHGHVGGRRYWNVWTPDRYVSAIEGGSSPEAGSEELEPDARRVELAQLALRTMQGVPLDAFDEADLRGVLRDLLTVWQTPEGEDRLVLTQRGRLLANEVALRLR